MTSVYLNSSTGVPESPKGLAGSTFIETRRAAFAQGRAFRSTLELSIPSGATLVVKIIVAVNSTVVGQELAIDIGQLKVETVVGGTEGGTFSTPVVNYPQNAQTSRPFPYYTATTVAATGGTHTGGTVVDVSRLKTDTQAQRSSSAGAVVGDERGVAPGTYYYRFVNLGSDTITGTFKTRFEENP